MSQEVAVKPADEIRNLINVVEARKDAFRVLLPKYLTTEKLVQGGTVGHQMAGAGRE